MLIALLLRNYFAAIYNDAFEFLKAGNGQVKHVIKIL